MDEHDLEVERRLSKMEEKLENLENVPDQLTALNLRLSKYDGRWGMLVMLGTAIWAMFSLFKDNIVSFFK